MDYLADSTIVYDRNQSTWSVHRNMILDKTGNVRETRMGRTEWDQGAPKCSTATHKTG